jgi:hypothetical protein
MGHVLAQARMISWPTTPPTVEDGAVPSHSDVSDSDIRIDLVDDDLVPEELERAALSLRRDLLELDEVERVEAASAGQAPAGARSIGVAEVGALVVAAPPAMDVLTRVVAVVRAWLARGRSGGGAGDRPERLRITVNGQTLELSPTSEQQEALIEEFLRNARA